MSGLRIYHPTVRSGIVQVPVPPKTEFGTSKLVNVIVDDTGHAMVSEGVWSELELAASNGQQHGFLIMNEVPDPPALVVGGDPDFGRNTYLVEQEALREIAPAGVTTHVVDSGLYQNIRSN